jgi:hypothetical protein
MSKRPLRKEAMSPGDAEAVGLAALVFMTAEATRLGRFLAESGLTPDTLRARAAEPEILAAMLAHLLADESLLLVFAANSARDPEEVRRAHDVLAGAPTWDSA